MTSKGRGAKEEGRERDRRFLLVLVDEDCEGGALHSAAMHAVRGLCSGGGTGKPSVEQLVAVLPRWRESTGWLRPAEALRAMDSSGPRVEEGEGDAPPGWGADDVLQLLRGVEGHRMLDIVWVVGEGVCPESAVGLELYMVLCAAREYCGARVRVVYEGAGGQAKVWCRMLDGEAVDASGLEGGQFTAEMEERVLCRGVAWRVELQMPCMTDTGPSLSLYNIRLLSCPPTTEQGQHEGTGLQDSAATDQPANTTALEPTDGVTRTRWQLLVLKTVDRSTVPLHLLSASTCVVEPDPGPPQEKTAHFMKRWSSVGDAAMLCRMRCLRESSGLLWTQDLVLQEAAGSDADVHSQQVEGRLVLLMWDPQCASRLLAVDMRCESSSLGLRSVFVDVTSDAWRSWLHSDDAPAERKSVDAASPQMPPEETPRAQPMAWAENLGMWEVAKSSPGKSCGKVGGCGDRACWCTSSAQTTPSKAQGQSPARTMFSPQVASRRGTDGAAVSDQDHDGLGSASVHSSVHQSSHIACTPSEELRRVALDWVRCRDAGGAMLYDLRRSCSKRGGGALGETSLAGRGGARDKNRQRTADSHETSMPEPMTPASQAFLPVSTAVFVRCVRQRGLMKPDTMQSPRPPPRSAQARMLDYDLPYPPPVIAYGDYCALPEGDRLTLEWPLVGALPVAARHTHGIDPCPDGIVDMEAMEAAIKATVPKNKRGSIFTDLHTSVTDTPGSVAPGSKPQKNSTRLQQQQQEADKAAHQRPAASSGVKGEASRPGTSGRAAELSRQSVAGARSTGEGSKQAKGGGAPKPHADSGPRASSKVRKDEGDLLVGGGGKPPAHKKKAKTEVSAKNKHAIKIVSQQVLAEKIGRQHPKFESHFKLLYEYSALTLKSQHEDSFSTSIIAESDVRLAVNRMMAKAMPFTIGMVDLLGTPIGEASYGRHDGDAADGEGGAGGHMSSRDLGGMPSCQIVPGLNFSP